MTPRLRRFLLLVLGVAAYVAFTVLTPLKVWAGIMLGVCVALLLVVLWWLAAEPFPWPLPWRRR